MLPQYPRGPEPGTRALKVFSNDQQVGTLTEVNDIWQFEYAATWVSWEHAWDLSPAITRAAQHIVDGSTQRPVQWFFDNLLPEEAMRTAMAAKARLREADAFALLEYLGAESAGSLVLVPPDAPVPHLQGHRPLTDAQLAQRIGQMPQVPLASTSPKRMSLAGAQQKLLVNWDGAQLSEPLGITPSTHILKPDHLSPDYPHSVINEYAMMTLAGRLGLDVPRVWRHYCPQPVYIVERFDRTAAPDPQRLHAIDTCQLLNKSRVFKYNHARLPTLLQVVEASRNRLATRLGLYRWLVFNVLIANHDNHLKNISLMVSDEGVSLAKTYDLLSTGVYHTEAYPSSGPQWPDIDLAIALPGQPRYANVTRQGLLDAAVALGLPAQVGQRELEAMSSRIAPELDAIIERIEQENTRLPDDTRQFRGGELRLLRAIRHTIVADMLRRVA